MNTYDTKFKDQVKKRLYKFTLELINTLDSLSNDMVSKRLGEQLLRSGTSILASFIEDQSGSSKKDLINYLTHSLKSGNESKLWLSLLKDSKRIKPEVTDKHLIELNELTNILASSILKLKGKR